MPEPRQQIVLGIGEVLWDCFPDGRRPGGAPANVVYHATQLDHHGVLCSRIGIDPAGDELAGLLRTRRFDLEHLQRDPQLATGKVTVDTTDPSSPRFRIHENVAWDAFQCDAALEELAKRAAAVCAGTLAQRSPTSRATIYRCLRLAAGALTVYDVNLRPPFFDRDWIEDTLRLARIVKLNADEARVLSEMLHQPEDEPVDLARHLISAYDVELVCITRGAEGCLAVTCDMLHEEPGEPITVVDTVGAGDAFTAGLISGLLRDWDVAAALRLANRLGAGVAGRAGAMPDMTGILPGLLEEVRPGGG